MPLPKFSRRSGTPSKAAEPDPVWAGEPGAVQAARVQARRRLVGAVVLLGVGVVLFPLLFETAPRPLPTDVPIQVARRDAGPVVTVPAPRAAAASAPDAGATPAPVPAPAASEAAVAPPVVAPPAVEATAPSASRPAAAASVASVARAALPTATRPAPAASSPKPEPRLEPKPSPTLATRPAPTAAPTSAATPAVTPAATPAPPARATAEAPRAAPTPPPAASAPAGRFVIQVGAFSDPVALRDARARVEKLGLRTFTQDVETPAGRRTRVRVGPFETREQADGAAVRLKAAGLPAYILTP